MARQVTNDLTFQICDLWGVPLNDGFIGEHIAGTAEVDRPLNDLRTADVTIDIYHPAGNLVQKPNGPLTRIVKGFYNPTKASHPIFCGMLLEPDWKGSDGTLQLSMVDVVFRLQRAYLANPYSTPDGGRDIALVMYDILGRAANRLFPVGGPGLGITVGTLAPTYPINRQWDAGENIWDILSELSQLAGAPDIDFIPLNRTDGFHWEFNAYAPLGSDRQGQILFEYNTGLANCADMEYTPSGDPVNNYYTAMGQVPDDESFTAPMGYARHDGSLAAQGVEYEGWDTNDATDLAVERAKAAEMVGAYHDPPNFITVTPNPEGPGYPAVGVPPAWDVAYGFGDIVHCVGRKGTMQVDEAGRIMSDNLSEPDETGSLVVTLEIAPNVDPTGVVTF